MTRETDVNYLLLRQQMSMAQAQSSLSHQGRAAYEGLARGYSDQIDAYRRANVAMVERHY
jgi:hypothetical protein